MQCTLDLWLENRNGQVQLVATRFESGKGEPVCTGALHHRDPIAWTAAVRSLVIALLQWRSNAHSARRSAYVISARRGSPIRSLWGCLKKDKPYKWKKQLFGAQFNPTHLMDRNTKEETVLLYGAILNPETSLRIHFDGCQCEGPDDWNGLYSSLIAQCTAGSRDSEMQETASSPMRQVVNDEDARLARRLAASVLGLSEDFLHPEDALAIGLGMRLRCANLLRDTVDRITKFKAILSEELRSQEEEQIDYEPSKWTRRVDREFDAIGRVLEWCIDSVWLDDWPPLEREVRTAHAALEPSRNALCAVFTSAEKNPRKLAALVQSALAPGLLTKWKEIERRAVYLSKTAERTLAARNEANPGSTGRLTKTGELDTIAPAQSGVGATADGDDHCS